MTIAPPPSATPYRLRRLVASALLTLSLVVGGIAITATPAHAAGSVIGCFRLANGNSVWGLPVQLWMYYQNTWYVIGRSELGPNGCQYWNISGEYQNYPVLIVVNHTIGSASFSGTTPVAAPPGSGSQNLGTGLLTCKGCQ